MRAYESRIRAWAMNRGMEEFLTAKLDEVEDYMRKHGAMEKFYEAFPDYDSEMNEDNGHAGTNNVS